MIRLQKLHFVYITSLPDEVILMRHLFPFKKMKRFYSYEPPVTWSITSAIPPSSMWCDYCKQTSGQNRMGLPEELLVCKDCGARGTLTSHPASYAYPYGCLIGQVLLFILVFYLPLQWCIGICEKVCTA